MAISQADRIAFSSAIVTAATQIKSIAANQALIQVSISSLQATDNANANLFDPVNNLINGYQAELSALNGLGYTSFTNTDIQNAANRTVGNYFFPNQTNVTVPSLSGSNNVWTQIPPFALGYGIGKTYGETNPSVTDEPSLITAVQNFVTIGLEGYEGTCSLPMYNTESTCVTAGGTWTDLITSLTSTINSLLTFVTNEVTLIVTNDTSSPNQSQNAAAVNNINNILIPALNAWLSSPSTETGPLTALQTALNNRSTFITTRVSQIQTTLGTINQNVTNGTVTGSGYYLTRYNYLSLRINLLSGSLSQLSGMQTAYNAQTSLSAGIAAAAATYSAILPTTLLAASANGTQSISVISSSAYSVGDQVFLMADGQQELQFAIKSIANNLISLNSIVPAKYTTAINARLYKDIS